VLIASNREHSTRTTIMLGIPITQARVLLSFDCEEARFLPEGPQNVVVDGREALAWVNIQTAPDATRGAVHLRFWDTGECRKLPQPSRPGFLVPTNRPNVVFVGQGKEVGTLDLQTGEWVPLARIPDDDPRTIINDGRCVLDGRSVVFGTKDVRFQDPIAQLYLFTLEDRRVTVLADGQVCSNGKVFAREGHDLILFDIDTPRRSVTRYRLDLGRRTLETEGMAVNLQDVEGFPDGMVDAGERTAIIAIYNPYRGGAGRALRYDLVSGGVMEEWTTPGSPRVTCPLLVERNDGVKLVLTTAVEGMPKEQRRESPDAGNLFIADTTLPCVPPADVLHL
jgi:sugar lactone lactonase YvrE